MRGLGCRIYGLGLRVWGFKLDLLLALLVFFGGVRELLCLTMSDTETPVRPSYTTMP